MKPRATLLVALCVLAALLLATEVKGQAGGIVVEGADESLTLDVTLSTWPPPELDPRFQLWYANQIRYVDVAPLDPAAILPLLDRFTLWYANQIRFLALAPPDPASLPPLLDRFRVWYSNQIAYLTLNSPPNGFPPSIADRFVLWYANENHYHNLTYPLGLISDSTPPQISAISASAASSTSWRVTWSTDELADSVVVYGLQSGTYSFTADDRLYATDHLVLLEGLTLGATYYYRVCSTDLSGNMAQSPEMSFVVALPAPPAIASITPDSAVNDGTVHISDLSGSGFHVGATVLLRRSGESDILATNVVVVDASRITGDFSLVGVAGGSWDVMVTNTDGQTGSLAAGFTVLATFVPNDPLFAQQWGLQKIEVLGAWPYSQGNADVLIAVIDTGLEYGHVDIAGSRPLTESDYDYVNDDADASDDEGHGTHVAGIAAANTNNGYGIAGLCPNCRLLALKVLNAAGQGSVDDLADAVRYATDVGADVINLSLGSSSCSTDLADAINYAYDHGVVIVAAAGNACPVKVALEQETFDVNYPAKFSRVVAVGATGTLDNRACFSCYGAEVDVAAPGVGILSTYPSGGYKRLDGTSMASPMVAGLSGLLLSQEPSLTPAQLQRILEVSADDVAGVGWDEGTGWGRINASTAMQTTVGAVTPVPPVTCPVIVESPTGITATREQTLVSLYAQVRDDVLLASSVGKRYVSYYGHYGPELAAILVTDADLRSRSALFLDHASEEFESLLPGSTDVITFTQELYDEGSSLVQDLASAGSQEFGDAMLQVWGDLALVEKIGEEPIEIWEEMQVVPVYLPLVIR